MPTVTSTDGGGRGAVDYYFSQGIEHVRAGRWVLLLLQFVSVVIEPYPISG